MLNADDIRRDAERRAGCADPSPANFRPQLECLVASINAEADLSEEGEKAVGANLVQRTADRLSGLKRIAEHPDIADEPIEQPVFLAGLPRSGTTFLQYLFDCDERFRLVRTWEANTPDPPPGPDPASAAARLAAETERRRAHAIKGFEAMHLNDADGPEECHPFMEQSYTAAGFHNMLRVPSYFDFLCSEVDFVPAYRLHKRQLQLLQWGGPVRRWGLKYPNHILAMDAIFAVYPDAHFVLTHRDPVQTLASICKLTKTLRQFRSSTAVDPNVVGREMLAFVGRHVDAIMQFAGSPGGNRVTHIDYYRLVDDPLQVMTDVHAALAIDTPLTLRDAVADWHDRNPKGARGANRYALEDFGIDEDEAVARFSAYMKHFDIPREREGMAGTHV